MTITTLNENAEYINRLEEWQTVRDCMAGAKTVKDAGEDYLPIPNPSDTSHENILRYRQYKKRAQFVNFTARSARGFVGLVRQREPIVELPPDMEYLIKSATASGVGLNQLADDTVRELLATGRYGYLADYPEQPRNLSKAETKRIGNKGRILTYQAEQIPRWHESIIDGVRVLDYVKLVEPVEKLGKNGNTIEETFQYRVLRLSPQELLDQEGNQILDDNGDIKFTNPIYTQALYDDEATSTLIGDIMIPLQSDGQPFNFIPFIFAGSESNDPKVDPAPLYDIADINIGHYRNSADYEESAFVVGQPMLGIVTDISSEAWANANPNFSFGCRAGVFLGANGDLKLVQAQPNTIAKEAMDSKENQLKMIGAKMIETDNTAETATAARITNGAENSVLGKIVLNTSDAIVTAIGWLGLFQGVLTKDVIFELNTRFYDPGVDPQAIMASIALYDRGIIAKADVQDFSRKQGVVDSDRTNEDIDKDAVDNVMEQL